MVAQMVSPFESKELRDTDLGDGMDIGMPSIKVYYFFNTFFAMCPSMVFKCFNTSSQCKIAFSISFLFELSIFNFLIISCRLSFLKSPFEIVI